MPRTFVNQGSCVRRAPGACAPPLYDSAALKLDTATLRHWHTASGKHVYAVRGLRAQDAKTAPACTPAAKSRWVKVADEGGCGSAAATDAIAAAGTTSTRADAESTRVVAAALAAAMATAGGGGSSGSGSSPSVVDVNVGDFSGSPAAQSSVCLADGVSVGAHVEVGEACWLHSHPSEANV